MWYTVVQRCEYHLSRVEGREVKTFLFSSRNVLITDATVKRLRCWWTLCPASLIVRPWLMTWSTKVALISSEIGVHAWPLRPGPCPPRPRPLALPPSMLANYLKWLNWGLFVAGWLVFSLASKCLQVCIWVVVITRCVLYFGYMCFPNGTLRFHFWSKCLMYEIECSMQDQVCCIKE